MTTQTQNAMTSRNIKLGPTEMECLRGLCIRWGATQSEAVRRAVTMAAEVTEAFDVDVKPTREEGETAIWEELSTRVDHLCFDVKKLENRMARVEGSLSERGNVIYGVVSLDDDEDPCGLLPGASEPAPDEGKKKKRKSKKGKKGTR